MANSNPNQIPKTYLRHVTTYNPLVRQDVCNPAYGMAGATRWKVFTATEKEYKRQSLEFAENGTFLNSDEAIEICAGERGNDKGESVLIHSRRGNISITADRTGTIKIKGQHIVIEGEGDMEWSTGNNFSIKGNNVNISGNAVNTDAMSGNQVPLELQFAFKVFEGSFVGGDLVAGALGFFLG